MVVSTETEEWNDGIASACVSLAYRDLYHFPAGSTSIVVGTEIEEWKYGIPSACGNRMYRELRTPSLLVLLEIRVE